MEWICIGEKLEKIRENLPRSHFVHHEIHIEWPRRELGIAMVGSKRLTAWRLRSVCIPFTPGVFNFLSSRANLHLSYNPAGRSNCRLQNHHENIKHHHRDMGGSPGGVREVPMTYVTQRNGCRMSCDVGKAAEGSQLILQPFRCFAYVIGTSPTSQLILQPFRGFIYATAHSTTLPPLHLRHRSFYNPPVASLTTQALHVLHLASRPCIGGWKNSLWWTSLLQQVTKFRSSYSFG